MMKRIIPAAMLGIVLTATVITSCDKKNDATPNPPQIYFVSGNGSSSQDQVVKPGDTVYTNVVAAQSKEGDQLRTFTVYVSVDGRKDSAIRNLEIPASQAASYNFQQQIITRMAAGTERYTYMVTSKANLSNAISIQFTTRP